LYDYFEGVVREKRLTSAVLECGGVGYKFLIPLSTFAVLEEGRGAKLLAYLLVRDDQLKLYGFATREERDFFEMLISVSGIGPALGLALLSGSSVDSLKNAILNEDFTYLKKIKGVGLKTAQRIVLELKGGIEEMAAAGATATDEAAQNRNDACKALLSLGFSPRQADEAVRRALERIGKDAPVEELLRQALGLVR